MCAQLNPQYARVMFPPEAEATNPLSVHCCAQNCRGAIPRWSFSDTRLERQGLGMKCHDNSLHSTKIFEIFICRKKNKIPVDSLILGLGRNPRGLRLSFLKKSATIRKKNLLVENLYVARHILPEDVYLSYRPVFSLSLYSL